jgi:hypothetical protein
VQIAEPNNELNSTWGWFVDLDVDYDDNEYF